MDADCAADDGFIGHREELGRLDQAFRAALAGHGHVILIAGEPGIGKTRLAHEFLRAAIARDAQVVIGRCHAGDGAPPYWPWIQVLRGYTQECNGQAMPIEMRPWAEIVSQIVPEMPDRIRDNESLMAFEPPAARFRLFDAITRFLTNAARSRPLAMLLDDVHCMDEPSLLLLEFLTRQMADARLCLVCTARDTEFEASAQFATTSAELSRLPHFERLELRGLDETETAELIAHTGGMPPPRHLVEQLYRDTQGNPLFVSEMVRLLVSESRLPVAERPSRSTLPDGIRHVIAQRLQRLTPQCVEVLRLAAVAGLEFDRALLAQMSALDADALLDHLDEARNARVLADVPQHIGRFTFAHGLVRESLCDALPAAHRVHLHHQIAETLERRYGDQPGEHVAELAYHFFEAIPAAPATKAVEYCRRAGDRAMRLLAHQEAIGHYQRALQCLDLAVPGDERTRYAVLLALGEAFDRGRRAASDWETARKFFLKAAESAHRLGSWREFARAAIAYGGGRRFFEIGRFDTTCVSLLEEALRDAPEEEGVLQLRLRCRLAEGYLFADPDRARQLGSQALASARKLGDEPGLLDALLAWHYVSWSPDNTRERLAITDEVRRLAEKTGDYDSALLAWSWRLVSLMECGDVQHVDAEFADYRRLAAASHEPFWDFTVRLFQAMRATATGRLDEAERMIEENFATRQGPAESNARLNCAGQLAVVRYAQGRSDEIDATIGMLLQEHPRLSTLEWCIPIFLHELGRDVDAAEFFERLTAHDFDDVPRSGDWLPSMYLAGYACAFLGDTARAEILYRALLPYADRVPVTPFGSICYGPTAGILGRLATMLRRWDEAEDHFADAIKKTLQFGLPLYLPFTQHDYAAMLLDRGRAEDERPARVLLERALNGAGRFGMRALASRIRQTLSRVPDESAPGASPLQRCARGIPLAATGAIECAFRHEGDYWTIARAEVVMRLRDSIGLRHIAQLLKHPGRDFLALQLLTELNGDDGRAAVPADAGEMLDSRARASYRHRLRELRGELEEAETLHDGRATRIHEEIAFIEDELSRAVGLGGRNRRAGSSIERARVSVTRTIRAAIQRIGEHDDVLKYHLDAAIKTGSYCSYTPDPRTPIVWSL